MKAICPCQHCSQPIEFEIGSVGDAGACWSCGLETTLFMPPTKPKMPAAEAPVTCRQLRMRAHLKGIRADSCYPVLRAVFKVGIAILICLAILAGVFVRLAVAADGDGTGFPSAITTVLGVGAMVLLLLAVRQSGLLLVDIADTLLDHHSR